MTYPFVKSAVDLGRARGPRLAFVIHHAEGGGTVGYLSRPNPNGVSVHFVIERSGRTVQMLGLERMHSSIRASAIRTTNDPDGFYGAKARTAVMGQWGDIRQTLGPNHASIAVEIEGFARDGPNTAQQAALKALYADLRRTFPGIRSLGHRDFASYKACPGKRIPWSQVGGHGRQPAPIQEAPVATDPNVRLAKAIEDQGRYLGNKFEKGDTSDAIGRLAKVSGFVSRILTSLSPVAVAAPSDSDETVSSGFFPSWADARAGKIDLSGPAQDAYGGFMQWVATKLGWATPPAGSLFARGDQNDAWQLATNFLGHGERHYPSDVYPVIPSDVLEAVFGSSDPTAISAAIEPYRAKLRSGGVPIEDRPETAA